MSSLKKFAIKPDVLNALEPVFKKIKEGLVDLQDASIDICENLGVALNSDHAPLFVSVTKAHDPVIRHNVGPALVIPVHGHAIQYVGLSASTLVSEGVVTCVDSTTPIFFNDCSKFKYLVIPLATAVSGNPHGLLGLEMPTVKPKVYKDRPDLGIKHKVLSESELSKITKPALKTAEVTVSGFRHGNGQNAFDNVEDGEAAFNAVCESLGFAAHERSISVFVPIKEFIDPHEDSIGDCLAICLKGEGTLHYDNKGTFESAEFKKGSVMYFNDTNAHFVHCSKPTLFLVGNIELDLEALNKFYSLDL